jgi:hypothetical protein
LRRCLPWEEHYEPTHRHALLVLAVGGFPETALAQTSPWLGLWQLNLAKSKFSPAPPYKSLTVYRSQAEGQNPKVTESGIDAAGNSFSLAMPEAIADGKPHPVTGSPLIEAFAATVVDANTLTYSPMKDGKVVATGTFVMSPDGRTYTLTLTGTLRDGQQFNWVMVHDKQ